MKISMPVRVIAVAACLVFACSILKKDNADKDIRVFLSSFKASLTQPDEVILKQFDSKQSRVAILSAIKILQNKEDEFVVCEANFDKATIMIEEDDIQVTVPVVFRSKDLEMDYEKESNLTLWLSSRTDGIVITQLDGFALYKQFAELRNEMQWSVDQEKEKVKRQAIFARAKILQQNFDSLIWYTTYQSKNYFYAVNGKWDIDNSQNKRPQEGYTMGLLDEAGNTLVPMAYELIGTIGFDLPNIVEVKKAGKAGYFNIETKQLVVPTTYDMIIPYNQENAVCIVKQDTVYGWYNDQMVYAEGFPSTKAADWVNHFEFMPKEIRFPGAQHALCEIPNENSIGYGVLMPPSYLVKTGLFNEIMAGLSTTSIPMSGWTEYVEARGTIFERITDQVNAMITTITNRYIEGREEFYVENRLVFMNYRNDTLAVSNINTKQIESIRRIGTDLLEVKAVPYNEWLDEESPEYDVPEYTYFRLREGVTIVPQVASRRYPQTQFAKLDSSYITGQFRTYDASKGNEIVPVSFLSAETLEYMHMDILASYGMTYPEEEKYRFGANYNPRYTKREEFEDQLTEIDRYNLQFLEKVIALLKTKPA